MGGVLFAWPKAELAETAGRTYGTGAADPIDIIESSHQGLFPFSIPCPVEQVALALRRLPEIHEHDADFARSDGGRP